jgi:hypothetical protein
MKNLRQFVQKLLKDSEAAHSLNADIVATEYNVIVQEVTHVSNPSEKFLSSLVSIFVRDHAEKLSEHPNFMYGRVTEMTIVLQIRVA